MAVIIKDYELFRDLLDGGKESTPDENNVQNEQIVKLDVHTEAGKLSLLSPRLANSYDSEIGKGGQTFATRRPWPSNSTITPSSTNSVSQKTDNFTRESPKRVVHVSQANRMSVAMSPSSAETSFSINRRSNTVKTAQDVGIVPRQGKIDNDSLSSAIDKEIKLFASARTRDQRLRSAKKRRQEAERQRIYRIESEIQGREERAKIAIQRNGRRAHLEREIRLLKRQERTERNMQKYWDLRCQKVADTVNKSKKRRSPTRKGIISGLKQVDGDIINSSTSDRNLHLSSSNASAAALHDRQIDSIRRISQREQERVAKMVGKASLRQSRVESLMDKRARERQRQADYRAKLVREEAKSKFSEKQSKNQAMMSYFKGRETVAQFAERRARSGLRTAGASVLNCGGGGSMRHASVNLSPRSMTAGLSPRPSPRTAPRLRIGEDNNSNFPPTASSFVESHHQRHSEFSVGGSNGERSGNRENPLNKDNAFYRDPASGGPLMDLPPQRHGTVAQWDDSNQIQMSTNANQLGPHRYNNVAALQQRGEMNNRRQGWLEQPDQTWQSQQPQQGNDKSMGSYMQPPLHVPQPQGSQHCQSASFHNQVVAASYGVQCWYYIDPQGNTQGPFDDMQMQQWHENGYFTPDLKMKRGDHSDFAPLSLIFENLEAAFQPGQGPVPPYYS